MPRSKGKGVREFARTIRDRRIDSGLSVVQLSEMLGVNPMTIYRWEQGKASPHPFLLKRLAKVLVQKPTNN